MASGKRIMPCDAGITLGMGSDNERRHYIVTSFPSWAYTQIYPYGAEVGLFRMKQDNTMAVNITNISSWVPSPSTGVVLPNI